MGAWRSGIEREKDSGTAVLWAYHEISWFRLGVIGFVIRMLHVVIIFKCSKQILGFWYQRIYLRQHTRHTNSELWFIAAKSWIAVDVPASTIEPFHTNYNKYFSLRSHTNSYNTLFIWVWAASICGRAENIIRSNLRLLQSAFRTLVWTAISVFFMWKFNV